MKSGIVHLSNVNKLFYHQFLCISIMTVARRNFRTKQVTDFSWHASFFGHLPYYRMKNCRNEEQLHMESFKNTASFLAPLSKQGFSIPYRICNSIVWNQNSRSNDNVIVSQRFKYDKFCGFVSLNVGISILIDETIRYNQRLKSLI